MTRSNYLILLGTLSLLAVFPLAPPFSVRSMDDERAVLHSVPLQMGEWKGRDLALDERTYEILETRNVLSRVYQNAKDGSVHLLIVSSHKDRRVAHPPEVCYLSSHYSILNSGKELFRGNGQNIFLKSFIAQDTKNPAHEEKVLYVYKVGKRFTTNYFAQQLLFAWNRATRQETEIQLIRFAGSKDSPFQAFFEVVLKYLSQS